MTQKHGWFTIPGVQTGERELQERIAPLESLRRVAKGAQVLDVGCAEGLIGKWLIDECGAVWLHGLDKHVPYLETAREIMDGYPAWFCQADFDNFDPTHAVYRLLSSYKIVLALNIIQKLKEPAKFIKILAALTSDTLVLSLPARIIDDVRSGNVRVDPVKVLGKEFVLTETQPGYIDPGKGHLGIRMFFRRRYLVLKERQRQRIKRALRAKRK